MQFVTRFIIPYVIMLTVIFVPAISFANTINVYDNPKEQAKIIGTIDLSAGIIPIYTPQNSQWTKVADPRNGNTGWVKNNELKDSKGNVITFTQKISESDAGQSIQMTQTTGAQMTPEQKKKLEAQLQQQEQTAKETLMKAQKSVAEVMEGLKKMYQQQLQIMEQSGFPVLMPSGSTAQPQGTMGHQPIMRPQQRGPNSMQGQQFNQQQNWQSGSQQMQGMQPPPPGMPPQQFQRPGMQGPQQMQGDPQQSGGASGTY